MAPSAVRSSTAAKQPAAHDEAARAQKQQPGTTRSAMLAPSERSKSGATIELDEQGNRSEHGVVTGEKARELGRVAFRWRRRA